MQRSVLSLADYSSAEMPPIVLFTDGWGRGGTEEHVLQLGRGLASRGLPVAAILASRKDLRWLWEELAAAGVKLHGVPDRGRSPFGGARRLLSLVSILSLYRGGVLHLHFTKYFGGSLVMIAAKVAGIRAIVRTEHNPPLRDATARDRTAVGLRDRFLARVIYSAESQRQEHLQKLGRDARKSTVIPLGVDLDRFSIITDEVLAGVNAELGFDPTVPLVGTVARFEEPRKGLRYFLEMAATVACTHPEVRFLMVGDGDARSNLEQWAEDLGIGERVLFTGQRRDVPRLVAAMRVFVMPSLQESGPYTVLEAMAMGRPVVATQVGLVPEAIEDHVTGMIAPPGDSRALAQGVVEVLDNPYFAEELGRRAREMVLSRFSLDTMVDKVAQVYREVAA